MLSFSDTELTLTMAAAAKLPVEARASFMVDAAKALALVSGDPQLLVHNILKAHLAKAMLGVSCPDGDHYGDSALAGPPHRATPIAPIPQRRASGRP